MRIFKKISQFSKAEIDTAFKKARRVVQHDGLTLLQAPAQSDSGRILIMASRKVGNAPERNKLRRQIKNIFFEKKLYEMKHDLIAILRPAIKELTFDQLKELILTSYKQ